MKQFSIIIILFFLTTKLFSQKDTIINKRLLFFTASNVLTCSSTAVLLNSLWYKNFAKTNFHFFNDANEWLQMDKVGHFYSSYYLSKILVNGFKWTGIKNNDATIYGTSLGFFYISTIEIFDGFSENWGASKTDLIANLSGSMLFLSQNLILKNEPIKPKFSFHSTEFPNLRPEVLGYSLAEQIIKDYNGQTYWLSFNIKKISALNKVPKWLNLAIGYSGEGMVGGENNNFVNEKYNTNITKYRQYYLSLDIDLSEIKPKSKTLKLIFNAINIIKIPSPTIELSNSSLKFHYIYF